MLLLLFPGLIGLSNLLHGFIPTDLGDLMQALSLYDVKEGLKMHKF